MKTIGKVRQILQSVGVLLVGLQFCTAPHVHAQAPHSDTPPASQAKAPAVAWSRALVDSVMKSHLDSLQPSSTKEKSAAPATEPVKVLPGAEVRAAFEKGSPILNKDAHNYWVLAGRRDKPGQAELHEKDLDIFYVLQGTATFITGGKMLEGKATAPGEVRGTAIEGGESHTLAKDDVVIVPAGVPHWFKDVQGLFLYYVVKVQQP